MLDKIVGIIFGGLTTLLMKGAKHLLLRPTAMMMLALLGVVACSGENGGGGGHRNPVDVSSGSPYGGTSKPTRVKIGSAYEIKGQSYQPRFEPEYQQTGMASWYGPGFHGRATASGEKYDQYLMTAAHKTLPLPSLVRVTRVDNGHSVIVRVNDRGPFHGNRIIDLSKAAANDLKMIGSGVANVEVEYLHDETMEYIADLGLEAPKEMQIAGGGTLNSGAVYSPAKAIPPIREVAAIQTQDLPAPIPAKPAINVAWQEPVANLQPNIKVEKLQQGKMVESFAPIRTVQAMPLQASPLQASPSQMSPFKTSSQSLEDIIAQKTMQKNEQTATSEGGQFRVQTAAFSSLSNAQQHAKTLQPIAKPLISEVARDGATLYRVSLPTVENYEVAVAMLKKTKEMGFADARLMVE